jgi:hypothetical protein
MPPVSPFLLFSGLTLSPGNYYLLVGGPQNSTGADVGWIATNAPVITAGSGIRGIGFPQVYQ